MSKPEPAPTEKPTPEQYEARIHDLEDQLKKARSRKATSKETPAQETPSQTPPAETPTPPTAPTHYVKPWEKTCPDCGEPNPHFKDETKCKHCGAHLGAAATVEKLEKCPFCNSAEGATRI